MRNLICFTLVLLLGAATVQAQTPATKYGHMNLGNLLDELPSTIAANTTLNALAASLTAKGDSMAAVFQAEYAQLEKEYNEGALTPVQAQQRQIALQKKQEEIKAFEEDAQKQLDGRRNELLEPILGQVDKALREIAKEQGYLMIFDVSSGAMLFADEADDVTPLLKKKMGQ
ncbi:MAG: OmpH family outer membrane protein [Lewinellaceae bacterium]|nr:OmpH family outer membrane protein [Lewinellaceae bacterium]